MTELASTPEDPSRVTRAEATAMIKAVLTIFGRWSVSDPVGMTLLAAPDADTYSHWKRGQIDRLSRITTQRCLDLIAIQKNLAVLFNQLDQALAWPQKPNAAFDGRSALEKMIHDPEAGIRDVRAYLEAELHA